MSIDAIRQLIEENGLLKDQGRRAREEIKQLKSKVASNDNRNFVSFNRYRSEIDGLWRQIADLRRVNEELRAENAKYTEDEKLVAMLHEAAARIQYRIDNPYGA